MKEYTRTDLACEWGREGDASSPGIRRWEEAWPGGTLQYLQILTPDASLAMGRAQGEYITVQCGKIWELEGEEERQLEELLATLLRRMVFRLGKKKTGEELSVLVVGLGNREITADAIGPAVQKQLLVTRHLRSLEPEIFRAMECCTVSALAPGVLGQTGMEAGEVIAGAIRESRPDVVVAIDALAARSCQRLAATVQISDAGISPGAGIGNHRGALDRDSLGVPVIALGVPTVVDSSTLVWDALERAGIREVEDRLRDILENGRRFYVSPKEADLITVRTAQVLAHAVNRALVGVPAL